METNNYKAYQLLSFFVLKFSYTMLMLKDPSGKTIHKNEFYLINKNNPSYQLIRISSQSNYFLKEDEERIAFLSKQLSSRFNIDQNKLLNIYICLDNYDELSKFTNISIETNYYSGLDLTNVYPGIKNCVHDVEDEKGEINRILHDINTDIINKRKQKFRHFKINNYVSFIVGLLCVISFIGYCFLRNSYSDSASLIFMGGDYRMFTYGLGQYWRLLTCGFSHSSLAHLICNVYSLYIIGRYMEEKYGHLRYSLVLFFSIIAGSLTFGIFNSNDLAIGLSGGLYGLWGLYLTDIIINKIAVSRNFYYIIFLNIALNFTNNVAWQAHLGGLICGILFYFLFTNKDQLISFVLTIFLLFGGLGYKYFSNTKISPIYSATDMEVCKMLYDLGFENLSNITYDKLLEEYMIQGYYRIGE